MPSDPLPPNQQLVATGKWPIIGEKQPRNDSSPWQVTVRGLRSEAANLEPRRIQKASIHSTDNRPALCYALVKA